jgi:4-hydroxy-tetrahydrodipicolinate reductase
MYSINIIKGELSDMIKIAINGASGKMGQLAMQEIVKDGKFQLVGCIVAPDCTYQGRKVSEVIPSVPEQLIFQHDYSIIKSADAVLDFSLPDGLHTLLDNYDSLSTGSYPVLVSGTTGINDELKERLKKLSFQTGVLWASNFSLGIEVVCKLLRLSAKLLNPDNGYDIEIIEHHHRHKKDAPSGTAITLAEEIKSVLAPLDLQIITDRSTNKSARSEKEIGIQAIRGGDIIGEHEVFHIGEGEQLSIKHRASSRLTFIKGALASLEFLVKQKPGLYTLKDVLNQELD